MVNLPYMPDPTLPGLPLVRSITRNDDAQRLTELLEGGMSGEAEIGQERMPLAHIAILDDARQCFATLLQHGASPEQKNRYDTTTMELAISEGRVEMVHLLAAAGADMTRYHPEHGTYLHAAAQPTQPLARAMEIVDRLLAEGADIDRANGSQTLPKNNARQMGYAFACQFMFRQDLSDAVRGRTLDKDALYTPRKRPGLEEQYHQRFADMPVTWAWMDRILPQLEKKDEHITRTELAQAPERLAWMLVGGALPAMDAHLRAQGEKGIGLADFVEKNGLPKPSLEAVGKLCAEGLLMQQEWVRELPPQAMLVLCRAMPVEARERMPDYYQLMNELRNRQQDESRGR